MKTKSFKEYLEKRLSKHEITEIEQAARVEYESLKQLQQDIATAVSEYMEKNGIGFNDLVRKMGKSPAQVSKIIKGEANLTLATVAQLYAFMGRQAKIVSEHFPVDRA